MRSVRPTSNSLRSPLPIKLWLARLGVGLLMATALFFITLSRQHSNFTTIIQTSINDALVPVIDILSQPAVLAERMKQNAIHWNYTYEENEKLRAENAQLLKWQNLALKLEAENKSLRALTQLEAFPQLHYISARVVGSRVGSLEHSLHLALPANHNVKRDQAVLTQQGLVGRISEVGTRSASVLLLSDSNLRIPVISEKSRLRAMLAGDNTSNPTLLYLPDNQRPEQGERIVTSDDGHVFPAGIPIGEIHYDKDNKPRIITFTNGATIEYVLIATMQETVP